MICIYWNGETRLECLTENWWDLGLLSCKSMYVLRMSCVHDLFERYKEDMEEGEDQELIEEEVRVGNIHEDDEVVLDNKSKGDIKYDDLGQSSEGGDIGGGG